MIAPYASGIRRPRRIGDPEIEPQMAPVIAAPRPRDLSHVDPPAVPMVDNVEMAGQTDVSRPMADYAGATGIQADSPGRPEAPGTRHGVGGRIKDFLEAALYGIGNAHNAGADRGSPYAGLMSGLGAGIAAAAKPGALAQYKWNNIEQPRIDERNQQQAAQETMRQQGLLRGAQARKAQSDEQENTLTRPDRLEFIRANTRKATAEAVDAERPRPLPQRNAQILDADSPNIMQVDPATGHAVPILGADGQPVGRYRTPIAPKSDLAERHFDYTVNRDANKDAEAQRKEGGALLDDFEKVKKNVTALDTEKNEMWKATGQKPNAKGMVSYKGHDYAPAELSAMAQEKDAQWQAAQAEFSGMRQKVAGHPALELDESGVGARYKRSAPQANAGPSAKGGKVPVISAAKLAEGARRKGFTGPNAVDQFKQWFESIGGVIQ